MALLSIMVLAPALGCALPPAVIFAQATPNPLMGQKKFAVVPVAFASPLRVGVKLEDGYLANKSPEDVTGWAEAKDRLNAKFAEALVEQGFWDPAAAFVIRPKVTFVEPGFYVGVASAPAEAEVEVTITDKQGKEIDRIGMRPKCAGPTVGVRLANCGLIAGAMVAEYLGTRTGEPMSPAAAPSTTSTAAPAPTHPAAVGPSSGGCRKDTDCKGDRVCENGACTSPAPKSKQR